MRRIASVIIAAMACAGPAAAGEVGFAACLWGLRHAESPDTVLFDWRSCVVQDGKDEECGEWHVDALKAPNERQVDSVTLRKAWEAEDLAGHPGIAAYEGRFEVRFAPAPNAEDHEVRIGATFSDALPDNACKGEHPRGHFASTPGGLELRDGCKPGVDGCAAAGP